VTSFIAERSKEMIISTVKMER